MACAVTADASGLAIKQGGDNHDGSRMENSCGSVSGICLSDSKPLLPWLALSDSLCGRRRLRNRVPPPCSRPIANLSPIGACFLAGGVGGPLLPFGFRVPFSRAGNRVNKKRIGL